MRHQPALSTHEFFARARARLTLDVPPGLTDPNITPMRGDHDIDPVMEKIAMVRPIRPAAVLVPIVDHDEPTVLLTQRAQHLPDHPGQVSFPGGKIDKADNSPLDSALREAEEEVGLDRAYVTPIGYLDVYLTTLGYRIVPVVARVAPG
ncbi:MAG: CoA pyrophosphatase, partial [Pseudolabrys sp.]